MQNLNDSNQKKQGLIYGLLGMSIYGLFPVYSNFFVQRYDPVIFAGLTTLIASFPMVIRLQIRGDQKYLFGRTKYSKHLFGVAILSGIAVLIFFLGTRLTSGINSSLLIQLEPMYSVILAYFILGERRAIKEIGAIILMVFGACVVVFKGFAAPSTGDLLILITPVFYQLSHLVSKSVIDKIPDVQIITTARLFYGGIFLTILGIAWHPSAIWTFLSLENILAFILFGLIFRMLDAVLWYSALKRLPLSIVSALIPVSLPIAFIGSIIVLKEIPTLQQYVGLFAIMSGLIWISVQHLRSES